MPADDDALRTIVRRDSGETNREMLMRMATESGVEKPTIDRLVRLANAFEKLGLMLRALVRTGRLCKIEEQLHFRIATHRGRGGP